MPALAADERPEPPFADSDADAEAEAEADADAEAEADADADAEAICAARGERFKALPRSCTSLVALHRCFVNSGSNQPLPGADIMYRQGAISSDSRQADGPVVARRYGRQK